MAEMKVFVINLDEQEKDTGCAWFTLPCNIEALKQSIGLPPDSDRYLISDYDFPFANLQELEAGLCNITYHRNCSDMEETSEHFLCVHGRFYEYNE